MAILKVALLGHPILRKPAVPVPMDAIGTKDLNSFLDDMLATMHEYAGVGLAAPQVHTTSRVVVVHGPWTEDSTEDSKESDNEGTPVVLINPEIVEHSKSEEYDWEGCLSIPQIRGEVPRWEEIRVRAMSPLGEAMDFEADGFPARVIQHEIDHLDGVLFLDRMDDLERLAFLDEYTRYWRESPPEGAES